MIGCTRSPKFESEPTNLRQGPSSLFPINRLIKTAINPLNKRTLGCFQESFLSRIRTVFACLLTRFVIKLARPLSEWEAQFY
jgi:hypothetical protein